MSNLSEKYKSGNEENEGKVTQKENDDETSSSDVQVVTPVDSPVSKITKKENDNQEYESKITKKENNQDNEGKIAQKEYDEIDSPNVQVNSPVDSPGSEITQKINSKEDEGTIAQKGNTKENEDTITQKGNDKEDEGTIAQKGNKKEDEDTITQKGNNKEDEGTITQKVNKKEDEGTIAQKGKDNEDKIAKKENEEVFSNVQVNFPGLLKIKQRIKALKKVQKELTKHEVELYRKVYELDVKYCGLKEPLHERRRVILTGEQEPTEEDLDYSPYEVKERLVVAKVNRNWGIRSTDTEDITYYPRYDEVAKGIPNFWLRVFKNSRLVDFVEKYDEPILSHLQDIKKTFSSDPLRFTLEFYFSENEYFTNKVLTKHYDLQCVAVTKPCFIFEGPTIIKSEGCVINWKEDKNITFETTFRKQKHKARNYFRTCERSVRRDSFFEFFRNSFSIQDQDINNAIRIFCESDFEIGAYIKEKIIPKAYLYFTGELFEGDFVFEVSNSVDDKDDAAVIDDDKVIETRKLSLFQGGDTTTDGKDNTSVFDDDKTVDTDKIEKDFEKAEGNS